MSKIVIITDSLGMPRIEIPLEDTWIYKFMIQSKDDEIFPFAQRALTTKHIVARGLLTEILYCKPDKAIIQIGIVDCVRRALPRTVLSIASRIPKVRTLVLAFSSKHHYFMSKYWIGEHRLVPPDMFEKNIVQIIESLHAIGCKTSFIAIAPPGKTLIDKVYDVQNDVKKYNDILNQVAVNKSNFDVDILNPYFKHDAEDFLLEDGHHLNAYGATLVSEKVLQWNALMLKT
jgi:lysophospholipase L1-like esterase